MSHGFGGTRFARVAWVTAIVIGAIAVALMVPGKPGFATFIALGLLAAGVILTAPTLLLAAVFATTFAYWRVGPNSINMSISDAITVLAICAAAPYIPWKNRALQRILVGLAFYLALILISVLAHATQQSVAEWLHRSVLYGGCVVIGAAAADRGQTKLAMKAFIYSGAVVSVISIYATITSGLEPAFPLGMHKNAAGPLIAMGIVILIAAPWRAGIRPSWVRHLRVLLVLGLFATQSRGAGLALVGVIAIYAMRHREARQRVPIFFLTVSLALIVASAVTLQEENVDNPKFNGVDSRVGTYDVALGDVWSAHPFVGGGLRWFDTPGANAGVPHDIVVAELSETGIIGLVGLVILIGNTLYVLWPRRDPLGEAAFLIFLFEVLFGITGIFWLAGTLSLPMLMVGLAVAEPPSYRRRPMKQSALAPNER